MTAAHLVERVLPHVPYRRPSMLYPAYAPPGVNHAGPQRIVTGKGGEAYYTPDHYKMLIPLHNP